jgi:hypothetical protein
MKTPGARIGMPRFIGALVIAALLVAQPLAAAAATSTFANWAAVVVAGDFHAHPG